MRHPLLLLLLPIASIVFAACSGPTSNEAGSDNPIREVRPSDAIGGLAFNVWTCKDLECLNLETSETTLHTYTACAAVMEDAQTVGVSLCETRKRASVVSVPAICEPSGQACPNERRGAYNWDDARRSSSDAGADASADGGS